MGKTTDEYQDGNYIGFRNEDGKLYLMRCPKCRQENWALSVATGQCCWCGWEETNDAKAPEPVT